MAERMTFLLGGARSGKSTHALRLAEAAGKPVTFIATAVAFDDEMAIRIANHRAERPAHWNTLEAPRSVGRAVRSFDALQPVVILDCLTLLANNVILAVEPPEDARAVQSALDVEIDELLETVRESPAEWIIVSNEVGLGLVPPYPLGRVYRDVLGRANQRVAQAADRVFFMVAGLPMVVKS